MTAALPILGLLTLALGVLFQVSIYPKLHYSFGIGRAVVPRNNDNCQIIPELEACEGTMTTPIAAERQLKSHCRYMVPPTFWLVVSCLF